jgi:elongation factor G
LKKQSGGSGLLPIWNSNSALPIKNSWKAKTSRMVKRTLQFDWGITGGSIDKNYQKPIKDGFKAMMENGILAGYSIDSMKVRVYDGSMHAVDSKPIAFELCAKEGFKASCS